MQVNINSVHFKTDQKLDRFINDKLQKLSGLYDGIVSSDVVLRVENTEAPENKITEIRLKIRGNDLFASKQSKSFEEATDLTVDALRKQLTKYKEKIREK